MMFSVPTPAASERWSAAAADRSGAWEEVEHPRAGGGVYMSAASDDGSAVLEFPFETDKPVDLQSMVVWWRHGERRAAERFPHPLPRTLGPTSLATDGRRVFYNAPATGRVGAIDVEGEAVGQVIEVGGYPIDLAYEPLSGKVFVADAAGDRVVILEPEDGSVVGEIAVPEMPWSMAVRKGAALRRVPAGKGAGGHRCEARASGASGASGDGADGGVGERGGAGEGARAAAALDPQPGDAGG